MEKHIFSPASMDSMGFVLDKSLSKQCVSTGVGCTTDMPEVESCTEALQVDLISIPYLENLQHCSREP